MRITADPQQLVRESRCRIVTHVGALMAYTARCRQRPTICAPTLPPLLLAHFFFPLRLTTEASVECLGGVITLLTCGRQEQVIIAVHCSGDC